MNCEQVMEWMPHYLDGQLSLERAQIIRLHVDSCPGCAHHLEEARELSELWRSMAETVDVLQGEDIPDLVGSVMAEIEKFESGRSKRRVEPSSARRRFSPRTSWVHYSLAACLTFLLLQFGVFEGLAYHISEINGQMSNSVISLFGAPSDHSK
ncbi:anti-sigma factor family protein [Paenibacillus sp. sgz500958]|uniref:anti-sigma factor family protein n=1 Tax=Paenibacillus sp. sgz500958 TaxID=3242475 RepID=UPI0036D32AA9